jgi:hypothetical protein
MADDKSKAQKAVEKDPKGVAEKGNEQVQKQADKEVDQGFRGTQVDLTPNENYTVAGVTSGAPVPEAAADPVQARREATNPEAGRHA